MPRSLGEDPERYLSVSCLLSPSHIREIAYITPLHVFSSLGHTSYGGFVVGSINEYSAGHEHEPAKARYQADGFLGHLGISLLVRVYKVKETYNSSCFGHDPSEVDDIHKTRHQPCLQ